MRVFTTSVAARAACGLVLIVSASTAGAAIKKADCKAHAATIARISGELGMSGATGTRGGRGMLDQVQRWIADHDDAAVDALAADLDAALAGVKECESNGFFTQVSKVKSQCLTLKSAVLPWLRNAAALDPCQNTITEAIEKRDSDPDAAIAELRQAIEECRDITWTREARRQLAEAHFARGDLSRSDFANGRAQVHETLVTLEEFEPSQRDTVIAILANATVRAGKALMDSRAFDEAAEHWKSYIEQFGTTSFEPLFASSQVADGAYELRSLRDANFQWALACLETGDASCVAERVDADRAENGDTTDGVEALVTRSFELAGGASGGRGDAFLGVAFDLLDRWRAESPDSYQIKRMLQNELLDRPADERETMLRLTDHCWIPTEIAGMLREEEREFVEVATLAAACGGGNGEAAAMLAAVDVDRARSLLDKVILAGSAGERKAYEAELQNVLSTIGDADVTREIREGLEAERTRQRAAVANTRDNSEEIFADCTTVLATIQWNESREEDVSAEVRNFKTGCCSFLRNNRAGWVRHLKSKLGEDQVRIKQRLMDSYCTR